VHIAAYFAPSDRHPDWLARFSSIVGAGLNALVVPDTDVIPTIARIWTGSLNHGSPPNITTVECVLFEVDGAGSRRLESELRRLSEPWLLSVSIDAERLADRLVPAAIVYSKTLLLLAGDYRGSTNERDWEQRLHVRVLCPRSEGERDLAHRTFHALAPDDVDSLEALIEVFAREA
jgi:hypothetical protein